MAFSPETYALLLKKIEEGGGGGTGGAVIITDNGTALDKTFAEIYELLAAGTPCYVKYKDKTPNDLDEEYIYYDLLMPVIRVFKYNDVYRVLCGWSALVGASYVGLVGTPGVFTYTATDSSSYPTFLQNSYVKSESIYTGGSRDN